MNVKRRHLDWHVLVRGLWNHFPSGCWGLCDRQTAYIQVDHPIHVPIDHSFIIKGSVWVVTDSEYHAHVHTLAVRLVRVASGPFVSVEEMREIRDMA